MTDNEPHLKRSLGPIALISLGIGAIIGAGLFSITGLAAANYAGPAIVISFTIAALGCTFAGLCYSEFASIVPASGSAYSYAYTAFGKFVAWIIGWDLILEYGTGAATVCISWSAYVVSLLDQMGFHPPISLIASPWQPVHFSDGTEAYGIINLPAVVIAIMISLVLMRGIRESSLINALLVLVKVSVVLIFIGLGLHFIQKDNYEPFIPPNKGHFGEFGISGIMRGAGVVFFAYIGFDAVSIAAQESKHPQRNIPIGILGSLVICTVLYIAFAFVMTGLVNYRNLNVAAPVALAIDQTPYFWLNGLIKLAIIAGFSSVILVMLLGQSRIFYSMARDGLLPPFFAKIHPKYQTPWIANIILMVCVSTFVSMAPLSMVGEMTSIGTLLAFIVVCAGIIVLRHTQPNLHRPFKMPLGITFPILGILVCASMMFSLGEGNWIRLIGWLVIGLAIYLSYGRKHFLQTLSPNNPEDSHIESTKR